MIDRASAFGSFGPLGLDVASLALEQAPTVVNFVCGLGGLDVTPATLRWALSHTRPPRTTGPVYVPEEV